MLYGGFMAGRNALYELIPSLSQAVAIPVICVGNLSTGGTGKTPMVAYLAQHFHMSGLKVAILSRGYGRKDSRTPQVITPNSPLDYLPAQEIGDEALMLHQQIPNATLVLDGDRIRGANTALKKLKADLILMDDGFQHRRLRRNFNLLMVDSQRLFGNRHLLPAGPLRESLKSLKRADAVVLNKFDLRHPHFYMEAAELLNHIPPSKVFCSSYQFHQFKAANDNRKLSLSALKSMGPLCAFSGLANNDYFFAQLRGAGLELEDSRSFNDHHNYCANDIKTLMNMSAGRPLITTAKDAVKLKDLAMNSDEKILQQLWIAEIGLKIENENNFLQLFAPFVNPEDRSTLKPARP